MVEVKVYNQTGQQVKTVNLPTEIFAVQVKQSVVKEVADLLRANQRQVLAHTKGRSEVHGGGRKPWRQKGTGRARHGSIRSPLWRGGGVTFGPTKKRNFSKKINDKVKRKALKMVLSNKVATDHFIILDKLILESGKTSELAKIVKNVAGEKKKIVLALSTKSEKISRAANNLSYVSTLPATSLNVLELLKYPYLVVTEKAVEKIIKLYK